MIKFLKKIFKKREEITYGERDKNGFCDVYINGKKTGARKLIFTPEQIRKIKELQDKKQIKIPTK